MAPGTRVNCYCFFPPCLAILCSAELSSSRLSCNCIVVLSCKGGPCSNTVPIINHLLQELQYQHSIHLNINQATLSNLKFTIIIFDEARIILNKASSPLNASECLNIQRIRKILKTLMPEGDDMFHPAMISMSTDR